MAFETDSRSVLGGVWRHAAAAARQTHRLARATQVALLRLQIPAAAQPGLERIRKGSIYRSFTRTLARRIILSNLIGLVVLLSGMLWLSKHQEWLITAKRESLKVQGEIIAAAIAANASLERDNRLSFDPDRLPEIDSPRAPFRDDRFAAYELSLRPDQVGPVLRKLIQPTHHNTRGRIYDRDGELVVDSLMGPQRPKPDVIDGQEKVRVKTFWTRVTSWFDGSDLPVYREIGTANGTYYREVREALAGQSPNPMLLLNDAGKQIVSLAVPIQRRNNTVGALLLSTRPGEIDEVLATERRVLATFSLLAVLTTLLVSMLLARFIAGPVRRLSAAADHVSRSINARAELPDFSGREDEVGQLSGAFRRMTASLFRRIEASEKFAADVAHELKNPLTAAQSMAESLTYAKTPEQRNLCVTQIRSELKRLNRLITDVSNASRLDAELARQTHKPVDLQDVLHGVIGIFRDRAASDGVIVALAIDETMAGGLTVKGHDGRLGQVITNLVDNAVSFSSDGDTVTITARRVGSEVEFAIVDEGPGLPEDKLEKVFDRFYSDRPQSDRTQGKNSGLGLSISREIIAAHGGRIWAENRYDGNLHDGKPFDGTGSQTAGDRMSASGHPVAEAIEIVGARFIVRLPAMTQTASRGQMGLVWRQ